MSEHQKHARIKRREVGNFHTNEIAILGTPCGEIKKLAFTIIERLSTKYRIGYVDADHKSAEDHVADTSSALTYGSSKEYVDKIDYHRLDVNFHLNEFDFRSHFSPEDMVLVNGNHFNGKEQFIVIDSRKPLEKKLHKLSNVKLILLKENERVPDYIKESLPNFDHIPVIPIAETETVVKFVENTIVSAIPQLNGLVLAGGQSTRMKKDKGKIVYHEIEQRMHMLQLFEGITDMQYLSIRSNQMHEIDKHINYVEDKFVGLGPYGAILSAFQSDPNSAWLVTACDQPLLDKPTLQFLIDHRNPSKHATAFHNSETNFPEPLVTIWEPRAYPRLLYFLSLGYSCPRKVLINSDIQIVHLDDETPLKNANTPEEYHNLTRLVHS